MRQFSTVSEHDLGRGIDARSSEALIESGFWEDILNGDTLEKRLKKRKGYQGYAGYVPLRVTASTYSTGGGENLSLSFDPSIDLSSIRSTPLVVYGRNSSDNTLGEGLFTSDAVAYFPEFNSDPRKTLEVGSNTLTLDSSDHALDTSDIFVGIAESLDTLNLSNELIEVDEVRVDQTTHEVDLDYINGTGSTIPILVYYSDKQAVSGEVFISSPVSIAATTTDTLTVSAGTHGLNNFNIISKIYIDDGTENIEIGADLVTVDPSTGEVNVTLTNGSGSSIDVFVVLSSAPSANIVTGTVAASATGTIVIDTPDTPYIFTGIYLEQTLGGILEEVSPDTITYDATTNQTTITFINGTGSTANFEVYYEFGAIVTNTITVADTTSTITSAFTDSTPQLTVWGICHEDIYSTSSQKEGWVTHVDAYKRIGEERLVCGLGGNIFAARKQTEVGDTYALPSRYANLRNRMSTDTTVAPLFWDTGEVPARTRGYVTSDNAFSHGVEVLSATYNVNTTYTDYVLSVPSKAILDSAGSATTLASVISTVTDLEDYLTVTQMGFGGLNGSYKVKSIDDTSASTITISVENSNIDTSDCDEVDAGGTAGIYTDQVTLLTDSKFLSGDVLNADAITADYNITVMSSVGTIAVISGAVSNLLLPTGLRISGTRTSSVIPLRDVNATVNSDNVVQGDMLTYTPIKRQLRVKSVNPEDDITIGIVDGTVTLGSSDTDSFSVGREILLTSAGSYSGVQTIKSIVSSSVFTIDTTVTGTIASATLVGHTVEIDEELEWTDTTDNSAAVTVDTRWIPIEAPDDSFDLTPSTYVQHFPSGEYEDKPFLRSTIVNDTMYFINDDDTVMKFDGTNVYRAGLFRWQPGLFMTSNTSITDPLESNLNFAAITGVSQNIFEVASGDEGNFNVGDRVEHANDEARYTIIDLADGKVIVNDVVTGAAAGNIGKLSTYRYYFRLNAVDANQNIINSAYTGIEDYRIELTQLAGVNIKLVGMPQWDIYDYDRLEVEIYRSKLDTEAPFYRIASIPMSFNQSEGYIEYTDTTPDSSLNTTDLDVTSGLDDTSASISWSEPLRAKYITSADNRLVLGNVRDYPELDIQLFDDAGTVSESDLNGLIWKFRRSNENSSTASDMTNIVNYEWLDDTNATTIDPAADIAATTTTFTITSTGHGTAAGDWVYLYHDDASTGEDLRFAGYYQVASVAGDDMIFNQASDGTVPTGGINAILIATAPADVPVLTSEDNNYETRNGNTTIVKQRAMKRLADAINCTMRVCETTGFTPWMTAQAGADRALGQIIVRQPRSDSLTPEVVLPTTTAFSMFVSGLRRSSGAEASMTEKIYPSRVISSYANFPELFANPTVEVDTDILNVRDVNSADGQSITGIIPFFGDSTTQASLTESIVVTFKTNSVYTFNASNATTPQRLETQGLGCTAPFSIAATRSGINFANESGIYQITRSMTLRYVGELMERFWQESVNSNRLDLVMGHNYSLGRQYKLSVPVSSNTYNSDVYVYEHTREHVLGKGAWSRYDNHNVTGWANLSADAYFASTVGRVYSVRNTGEEQDYRDDDAAVSFSATYRPMNMGNSGIRKVASSVISHFRNLKNTTSTLLNFATDFSRSFASTTSFRLAKNNSINNLSDIEDKSVVGFRSSLERRKFLYLQLQYENNAIDDPVELASIDIRISGLSEHGIIEAQDT